ncbi:MAG: HRDC domain-containing protein [Anaerolineales bacterium]
MHTTSSPLFIATTPAQLNQLAGRLAQHALLGVDTESNSLHAYRERLCLLQITSPEEDALVDPLAVEDLAPIAGIFANPQIEKIFHAAEYDLIVLHRDYGFPFANLFDTMMAARILGRKRVGLGNLLEEEFGLVLDKRFQRADWGERPLRRELLEYARLDTHHLIELRERLKAELDERGRWELAKEDFERLPNLMRPNTAAQAEDPWQIKGARDLTPRQAAILLELAFYRDAKAAEADRPLFKIISDSTLTAIAIAQPQHPKDLETVEGMTAGQIQRHGKGLLDAVKRGQQAPPLKRPRRAPYDEAFVERVDKLRAWRKKAALELEVESDVVLPRDLMQAVARANPGSQDELAPVLADVPWRRVRYGEQILQALAAQPPPRRSN